MRCMMFTGARKAQCQRERDERQAARREAGNTPGQIFMDFIRTTTQGAVGWTGALMGTTPPPPSVINVPAQPAFQAPAPPAPPPSPAAPQGADSTALVVGGGVLTTALLGGLAYLVTR